MLISWLVPGRPGAARSGDGEHPVQRHLGPHGDVGIHRDLIDRPARHEFLEHPGQMGGIDAKHGGTGADERVERNDGLVWCLRRQSLHEVDLRGDGDGGPGWGGVHGSDDEVGGAHLVRHRAELMAALGMGDDDAIGMLGRNVSTWLGWNR